MLKKLKWYWKLLIIAIIMFFCSRCTNNGFIVNVKAEEVPNFYINVEDSDKLKTYYGDKFISNFMYENVCDNNTLICSRGSQVSSISSQVSQYNGVNSYYYYLTNDDFSYLGAGMGSSYLGTNIPLSIYDGSFNDFPSYYGTYLLSLYSKNEGNYLALQKGNIYEVLLQLKKGDNTKFRKNLGDLDIDNLFIGIESNYYNGSLHNPSYYGSEVIDLIKMSYFVYSDNNSSDNYAFIKIRFKLKDNISINNSYDESVYNTYNSFLLHSIGMTTNNGDFNFNVDRKCIAQNLITSTNDTGLRIMIDRVVMVENGSISFTPGATDDNLDTVSFNDLAVFDSLNTCDPLDLGCHIQNILSMIKNTFVRIGNLITGLVESFKSLLEEVLIPDFNDMSQMFMDFREAVLNKLGFLGYFINLFENFFVVFINNKII